jgi:hypothetical protein
MFLLLEKGMLLQGGTLTNLHFSVACFCMLHNNDSDLQQTWLQLGNIIQVKKKTKTTNRLK